MDGSFLQTQRAGEELVMLEKNNISVDEAFQVKGETSSSYIKQSS